MATGNIGTGNIFTLETFTKNIGRQYCASTQMNAMFIPALLLAFSISSATAGVLDNAWLQGVTDKDPVSYHAGEEIVFTVTPMDLDGPIPPDTYQLEWRYSDEGGKSDKGLQPFTEEPFVYRTSLDQPGFVRLEVYVLGPDGKRFEKSFVGDATTPEGRKAMNKYEKSNKKVFFDGGAGVDIDQIRTIPEKPADFDEFWDRQFKRLDLVPVKADLVEIESPRPDTTRRWAVRIDCAGLRPVTGYLTVPKAVDEGKRFPARLETAGYGVSMQGPPSSARDNEIVLNINAHGMKLREFGATEADWKALKWEISSHGATYAFNAKQNEDPEVAYFNGMFLRVKRALQYLKTLEGWNGKDLIASGGSQGGMQTIWAAACGEGVTDAWADIPWGCDWYSDKARLEGKFPTNNWYVPWTESLGYYECAFLAKRIPANCRVTISRAGLGDYTCPPRGIAAFWNALESDNASIRWVQGSTHGHVPPPYDGRDATRKKGD